MDKYLAAHFAVACAFAFAAAPSISTAADDRELADIRNEIKQLKEDYEARIRTLEARLQEAETKVAQAQSTAPSAATAQAAPAPTSTQSSASAFNPAISLILSGTYANLSQDPDTFQIGGFIPSGDEIGPGKRGFSLGESELAVSANIDPYFFGSFTAALTAENELEVEEAFFKTLALPSGFSLKGGRYFSGIGYLNEMHAHAWDFVDNPLVYQAFLGKQYIQNGLQAKWLAPTDLFLEFGLEAGNGEFFPGTDRNKNGFNAYAGFVHVGGDVGVSNSWRAGLSYLTNAPRDRSYDDVDSLGTAVTNSFSGTSRLWGVDFVWKWAPDGNSRERNFKLQGEYMRRKESGDLTFDTAGASGFGTQTGPYASTQSGWYLQGVYQFMPRWRGGLRYDRLESGTPSIGLTASGALSSADFPVLASHKPARATLMVDWRPSEFSTLRLQAAQDKSRFDATDNQIFLQYIYSLGAHGAHRF
jgi:hypothetical protein